MKDGTRGRKTGRKGERTMNVERLERGKQKRKKDCARGKKEETEKEYLLWKG